MFRFTYSFLLFQSFYRILLLLFFISYREVVCAFAVAFSAIIIWGVRWAPGTSIVASNRMLNFDYFCTGYINQYRLFFAIIHRQADTDNAYPRSPRICVQYGYQQCQRTSQRQYGMTWIGSLQLRFELTPASTRLISKTLTPANGNFLLFCAVANPRERHDPIR